MIEIVDFTEENRGLWDDVVSRSANGSFIHNSNFFTYHLNRFVDQSIIILKKSKPIAIFPANSIGDVIFSHQGLSYAGLIYITDVKAEMVLELLEMIKTYYANKGFSEIQYKAIPYCYTAAPAQEDLYALFRLNAKLYRRDLSTVINYHSEPLPYSKERKRSIKKAIKNNVTVTQSDEFSSFHTLLSAVLEKFGSTPVHSVEELELLADRFPQNIKLYAAYQEKEMIAATLLFEFETAIHTQYLASNNKGRDIGGLDLILDTLIEEYRGSKSYFCFGISCESQGQVLNAGLIRQKEGFGGRGVAHDSYQIPLS
jgi:hypothetical protein